MTQDRAIVEKAWMKAAELAIKFLGSTKGPKLAAEMGERLHLNLTISLRVIGGLQ